MTKLLLPILAAGVLATNPATAQVTYTYDFNSTTADFNSKFATPAHDPVVNATTGLSGTGALDRSTGSPAFVYFNTVIGRFTEAGQAATVQYYFFGSANNAAGSSDFLSFSTNPLNANPTSTSGTNPTAGVKSQIFNTLTPDTDPDPAVSNSVYSNSALRLESRNMGSNPVNTLDAETFVLPVTAATGAPSTSQWFFMTLSLTYNGGSDFSISTSLFNSSNTGVVGTNLESYSTTRTGLTSLVNTDIYAGFQLASTSGTPVRAGAGDNFEVTSTLTPVPEPSTYVVMLGGLGALLLFRRRRAS
jgi:hypothetical protein